jgi:hypothetical protein
MEYKDMKTFLVGLCLSGLLAGSGLGISATLAGCG